MSRCGRGWALLQAPLWQQGFWCYVEILSSYVVQFDWAHNLQRGQADTLPAHSIFATEFNAKAGNQRFGYWDADISLFALMTCSPLSRRYVPVVLKTLCSCMRNACAMHAQLACCALSLRRSECGTKFLALPLLMCLQLLYI